MLNQVVMIGKIVQMPMEERDEKGNRKISFILEIERPYRESGGNYAHDYVKVVPWKGIADQMKEMCTIDTIIAVKGRLYCMYKNGVGLEVIAEHISFLSTRSR